MRLRAIAIPAEHGGWGFLLEPIALGLLVVPSLAGVLIGLAAVAAFLTRQPLRLVLADRRRRKRHERTVVAERIGLVYAGIAAFGLLAAIREAGLVPLLPLLLVSPFLLIFLAYDVQRQSRALLAELAGPVALSATAASIGLAGGWYLAESLALWGVLIARAVPAILYVRARLRLSRGEDSHPAVPLAAHVAGLIVVAALVRVGLLPALAAVALLLLLLRAAVLLSRYVPSMTTRAVGFLELALGALTVVLVAAGYALGV